MSDLFIKAALGPHIVKLRITGEHAWRAATLENTAWLTELERGHLPLACHLWCMLDGNVKGISGPKDVFALITNENAEELWNAVTQCWDLAKTPGPGSKNANGSTPSQSPASS